MTERRRHRDPDQQADPRVAAVLAAAAAPTEPGPVPGEDAALRAFRVAVPRTTRRIRMLPTLKATAIAATATGALLVGGVAAASTGALPGAASDTARAALAKVGVTVNGPADAAAVHTSTRGSSAAAHAAHATATATAAATPEASTDASAHGKAVSELATTTTLTGKDKGVAISTLASDGRARAHQPTPTATATTATTATPTTGTGQATAAEHSGGRSTTGQAHRP